MASGSAVAEPFGALLRRRRLAAGLTQEGLAERAGLSVRGVSDLERGARRAPQRETVRRLARALGLRPAGATALEAGAAAARTAGAAGRPRGRASVLAAAPATWAPRDAGHGAGHNLPLQLTSFVGRERELAAVGGLLGTARLLTLTGPGGVGKTRLALEAAAGARATHPQGVWLVELAALADPALVPQAVAAVLGVREEPGRPLLATLADALRPRTLLLVLDNCEHLLDACARLAGALLRGCPRVRLLATSREPLGVAGEAAWPVPPLPVPALPGGCGAPARPRRAGAVRGGAPVRRAGGGGAPGVRPHRRQRGGGGGGLRPPGRAAPGDRAGRRARAGAPAPQLLARLDDRFRLLTGGGRDAPPRQQTLRATVEWSYALLDDPERRLFGRLAVFAGAWTLEAAEAVGADPGGDGGGAADVLDRLTRLVDQSLVVADEAAGRHRPLPAAGDAAPVRPGAAGGQRGGGGGRRAPRGPLPGPGGGGPRGPPGAGPGRVAGAPGGRPRRPARGAALAARAGRRGGRPAPGGGPGALLARPGPLRRGPGVADRGPGRARRRRPRGGHGEAAGAPAPDARPPPSGRRRSTRPAGWPSTRATGRAPRPSTGRPSPCGGRGATRPAWRGRSRPWRTRPTSGATPGGPGPCSSASLAGFRRAGDLHGAGLALCGLGTVVRHLEGPARPAPCTRRAWPSCGARPTRTAWPWP